MHAQIGGSFGGSHRASQLTVGARLRVKVQGQGQGQGQGLNGLHYVESDIRSSRISGDATEKSCMIPPSLVGGDGSGSGSGQGCGQG